MAGSWEGGGGSGAGCGSSSDGSSNEIQSLPILQGHTVSPAGYHCACGWGTVRFAAACEAFGGSAGWGQHERFKRTSVLAAWRACGTLVCIYIYRCMYIYGVSCVDTRIVCVYIYVHMYVCGVRVEGLLLCQHMSGITLPTHKTPVVSLLDVCMYVCIYVYIYTYYCFVNT